MEDAISNKDTQLYFELCVKFIEMALFPYTKKLDWGKVSWYEFLEIYSTVIKENSPRLEFPILTESKKESKKLPWEYKGRNWYFWLNLFAKSYGWDSDTVSKLDIDTAIGLFQETEIDHQMNKEWEWSLSELAFPYNESTKKSEYKPLDRPYWMLPIAEHPKKVIVPKDMMPMGNVIDLSKLEKDNAN